MRYKLTLKLTEPERNVLPVNYQYELGAWLMGMFNGPGNRLFDKLLELGFAQTGMPFRSFVFSHLAVPDRKIEGDRMVINCAAVSMIISTIPLEELVAVVQEHFHHHSLLLGDKNSRVSFRVERVEPTPLPEFNDKMTFRTISPLHLTAKITGKKNEQFLSPEVEDYATHFYNNLHQKYLLIHGAEHHHDPLAGKFKLRSPVTQKGITMQAGTTQANKLVGYQLRFRLHADPDLIRAGYYLGFGEKNHLGFGCCEAL